MKNYFLAILALAAMILILPNLAAAQDNNFDKKERLQYSQQSRKLPDNSNYSQGESTDYGTINKNSDSNGHDLTVNNNNTKRSKLDRPSQRTERSTIGVTEKPDKDYDQKTRPNHNQGYEKNRDRSKNPEYGKNPAYGKNPGHVKNPEYGKNPGHVKNPVYDKNPAYGKNPGQVKNPDYGKNLGYGQPGNNEHHDESKMVNPFDKKHNR
jgi:hypothetical protein